MFSFVEYQTNAIIDGINEAKNEGLDSIEFDGIINKPAMEIIKRACPDLKVKFKQYYLITGTVRNSYVFSW